MNFFHAPLNCRTKEILPESVNVLYSILSHEFLKRKGLIGAKIGRLNIDAPKNEPTIRPIVL